MPGKAELPTEAQWEKAFRGVDGRDFLQGDDVPGEHLRILDESDWSQRFPVDAFPDARSVYGVHGCDGNVFEWCRDDFRIDLLTRLSGGVADDPGDPDLKSLRRGNPALRAFPHTFTRRWGVSGGRDAFTGFRLVIADI